MIFDIFVFQRILNVFYLLHTIPASEPISSLGVAILFRFVMCLATTLVFVQEVFSVLEYSIRQGKGLFIIICSTAIIQNPRQPVQPLIKTVSSGCTRRLNEPLSVSHRLETKFVCDFGNCHCVG